MGNSRSGSSNSSDDAGDSGDGGGVNAALDQTDGGGVADDDDGMVARSDGVEQTEPELEAGRDKEGNIDDEVVVVAERDEQANEIDVPWDDDVDSLAEFNENQNYPEDDDVVEVVRASDLAGEIENWREMSPEELQNAVEENDMFTMDFPQSRLEDADLPGTDVTDGELADALGDRVDYGDVVSRTGRDDGDVDVEAVREAIDTHVSDATVPGSDQSRVEAVVEDVGEYDDVEDVIADARNSWLEDGYQEGMLAVTEEHGLEFWRGSYYDDQHGQLNEVIENGDTLDADRINVCDLGDSDGSVSALIASENGDFVVPSGTGSWLEDGRSRGVESSVGKALQAADEGTEVVITDLAPQDTEEFVNTIEEHGGDNPIKVRDHHGWDDAAVEAVENSHPESEVVIDGDANAAAEIYWSEDVNPDNLSSSVDGVSDEEFAQNLEESVEVAGVVDSRIEDSDQWEEASYMRASQYHHTHEDFTEAIARHGTDFHRESDMGREIAEMNLMSELQSAIAVGETAEMVTDEQSGRTVGFAFSGNGDRSAVGSALQEDGADFSVLVTDTTSRGESAESGDFNVKVSFRGTEEAAVADTIPEEFGGGGRDNGQAGSAEHYDATDAYGGEDVTPEEKKEQHQQQKGKPAIDSVRSALLSERDDGTTLFGEALQDSEE